MRWLVLAGVLAVTGNEGMADYVSSLGPKPSPSAPGAVTDLRIVAATDTSLVLTWTEVPSSLTVPAKYVLRYDTLRAGGFDWGGVKDVLTGGCAAPVYGSTAAGGRTRSCVLGGLTPRRGYRVRLVAYTGTLGSASFGPLSNVVEGTTAQRIGPMLVHRPPMVLESLAIAEASLPFDFGPRRYPVRGKFPAGDRVASFYDSTGALIAFGYLLLVQAP